MAKREEIESGLEMLLKGVIFACKNIKNTFASKSSKKKLMEDQISKFGFLSKSPLKKAPCPLWPLWKVAQMLRTDTKK